MKNLVLLIVISSLLCGKAIAQRVQGTLKAGATSNEVIVAIRPTVAFTALVSNIIVSVQVPTSVGPRPTIAFTNLQPNLFSTWVQLDADQGDGFYTWAFNSTAPGANNTPATLWSATELDLLAISFIGATVPPFTARLDHYLDGGVGGNAIFYVETNLAAVNGGVLSDWGNLFYGTGASNGATAAGSIGVPNALYSFTTVTNVTLPVKFLGFNVIKKDGNALLSWQIENESALTDRYEIERSLNGMDFKKINVLTPKKNGSSTNTYEYTELNLAAIKPEGPIYYRIKQIDKDGQFALSTIKNVRLDTRNLEVGVFPNPVKSNATLFLDLVKDARVTITINDASGKQVQNVPMQLFKGVNKKDINMSSLAAGSYLLKISTGDEVKTVHVVKTN
ncbi:MAG: T9SS type A sorting domain-containing protein [Bacteroidota bacterium]